MAPIRTLQADARISGYDDSSPGTSMGLEDPQPQSLVDRLIRIASEGLRRMYRAEYHRLGFTCRRSPARDPFHPRSPL